MVLPLLAGAAIAGGATLAGSILQYMNSQEGQRLTEEERAKMERLVNQIQTPNFQWQDIQPEDFQVVAKYVPQTAQVIAEKSPQLVKQSQGAQNASQVQNQILAQLREASMRGEDPMEILARNKALRNALGQSNAQGQSLQLEAQRRGIGANSGLALAGRLNANAANAQTAALAGEQAAADAAQRRQGAMGQAAGLAGQIYGQEMSQEEKNAAIINAFNQRMAQNQQNVMGQNVNAMNQGQLYNVGQANQAGTMNTQQRNAAKLQNQQGRMQAGQQNFQNQVAKTGLQTGVGQQRISDIANNTNQKNQAIQGATSGISNIAMYGGQNWDALTGEKKKKSYEETY